VAVIVAAVAEGVLVLSLLHGRSLRLGVSGLLLDITMLVTFIPLYRHRRFSRRALGLRGAPPGKSVGLVFCAVIAIAITNELWLRGVLGLRQPNSLGITLRGGTGPLIAAGFFMSFSAPITEEIFFRGFLYRALRNRMVVPLAVATDGILFGLVHGLSYPLDTLPPRMVFGAIACLLYEETGSLWPGIALHCLIDASGFEVAVTGHNRIVLPTFLGLAAILLIYAGIRRVRPREQAPLPQPVRPDHANPA
jgi:membrane protease YdiL (CAAX protease family)